jgi:hypothetical protein
LTTFGGPGYIASITEDEVKQCANRNASRRPSPSNAGSRSHGDACPQGVIDCDCDSAMPRVGERRPLNVKRKGPPSSCNDQRQKKRKYQLRRSTRYQPSGTSHQDHPTYKTDRGTKGQLLAGAFRITRLEHQDVAKWE